MTKPNTVETTFTRAARMVAAATICLPSPPSVGQVVEVGGRSVAIISVTDDELMVDYPVPETTYRYEVSE